MFDSAETFNQDLTTWCVKSVQNYEYFASGSPLQSSSNLPPFDTSANCGKNGDASGKVAVNTEACVVYEKANFDGEVLALLNDVESTEACCDACAKNSTCNIWVYCPVTEGCDNGYGEIYAHQLCTLKYQDLVQGQKPVEFVTENDIFWISGVTRIPGL
jgi:hypothetical protein